MNQYSTEPEYTVKESERIHLTESQPVNTAQRYHMVEVVAELALLSKELDMASDILGKIRDSVHVLVLSLPEQV